MKISILIPTLGRETLSVVLQALLDSNDFSIIQPEILVIFDGHQTHPLQQFSSEKSIRIIETGKKVYSGGARNVGLEHATGDVIVFIGDDTIPQRDWLQKIFDFHTHDPRRESALLGRISWPSELAQDAFHQWLESHAQFDFVCLNRGTTPTWRHFYTSNISLKRSCIETERFSDQFVGWGFEDSEFGYRLVQKGLQITYDSTCEVVHDHRQTPEKVWQQTKNARKNARVFERLHPEVQILPRGTKLLFLRIILICLRPFIWIPTVRWCWRWKKTWIDED